MLNSKSRESINDWNTALLAFKTNPLVYCKPQFNRVLEIHGLEPGEVNTMVLEYKRVYSIILPNYVNQTWYT